MEEELVSLFPNFTLPEAETEPIILSEEDILPALQQCRISVFGKIWSNKYRFKASRVRREFGKLWGIEEWLVVYRVAGVNIFQFIIPDDEVRERVLFNRPWHFDKHLVVMRAWTDDDCSIFFNNSHFTRTPFWIQVLDLPITFLNEAAAGKIAGEVGKCLQVEIRDKVLRIRIELDITNPLRRGIQLLESGTEHTLWAPFRYEKLGSFCYICGCVGHTQWSCPESSEMGVNQYGPWLRAAESLEEKEERKCVYEEESKNSEPSPATSNPFLGWSSLYCPSPKHLSSSGSTSENKGRRKKLKGKREKEGEARGSI